MTELEKQFDHHFKVICSSQFQKGAGLGNEVPFFISTFPPEKQTEADKLIKILKTYLYNFLMEVRLFLKWLVHLILY